DKVLGADGKKITNIAGLKFDYTVTDTTGREITSGFANAGTYVTTVQISIKEGVNGYVLDPTSQTSFHIEWTILPVDFDLKSLTFSPNATYDSKNHEMLITNEQIAPMVAEADGDYVNSAISAGNYKAGFFLEFDPTGNMNYHFSDDMIPDEDGKYKLANGAIVWLDESGNAYVEYDWFIAQAEITIGASNSYWKEDIMTDKNGAQFKSFLPKVYDEYGEGILDVRYYEDRNCTKEINIEDVIVEYELEKPYTYYVQVTINDAAKRNYKLMPNDSAVKSFNVGSTKKGLEIKVNAQGEKVGKVEDSANEFAATYSDKGYNFTATAAGFASSRFDIAYSKLNDNGDWEDISGRPTEVGDYKITVSIKGGSDEYEIKNAEYYLTIYAQDDPDMPDITEIPPDLPDPENPDDPNLPSGEIPSGEEPSGDVSGNDPSGDNGGGTLSFGNIDEFLKQWWQVIASAISIVLIIIFLSKTAGYESKRKKFNKKTDKLGSNVYAVATTGLFGLAMTSWTAIACTLMGLAVASLVIMIIAKNRCSKAEDEYEDVLAEYQQKKEDNMRMMLMGMGNNGAMPQGFAYQPAFGVDEMRGLISETVTAMLPGVQQMLPQQA
ncbi:MAG: hypothetical protein K2I23_06620, partial [Clostridia bacterium]|nr:hypothetical protein [Clostridia bacterium]